LRPKTVVHMRDSADIYCQTMMPLYSRGAYDTSVCTHNSSCAGVARRCRELRGGTEGESWNAE